MIRQFDVCENPSRKGREERPFVLILQSTHLSDLRTRIGAPLVVQSAYQPDLRLNPAFRVQGQMLQMSPTELATFPVRVLGPAIANLEDERDSIIAALDLVFTGI